MLKRSFLGVLAVTVLLTGCSTFVGEETVPEPIGIGPGLHDLKRSPCACIEVPQNFDSWKKA